MLVHRQITISTIMCNSINCMYTVPGPPQNFATTLVSATSVTLMWDPPLPDEQNGIITKYTVRVTPAESAIYEEITTTTRHLVDSLEANQLYSFVVAAHTVAGKGTFSNTITVQTRTDSKSLAEYRRIDITYYIIFPHSTFSSTQ